MVKAKRPRQFSMNFGVSGTEGRGLGGCGPWGDNEPPTLLLTNRGFAFTSWASSLRTHTAGVPKKLRIKALDSWEDWEDRSY